MKVSSRKEVVGKVPAILSIVSGLGITAATNNCREESMHVLKF